MVKEELNNILRLTTGDAKILNVEETDFGQLRVTCVTPMGTEYVELFTYNPPTVLFFYMDLIITELTGTRYTRFSDEYWDKSEKMQ